MADAFIRNSKNSTLLFLAGIGATYLMKISQEQIDQMQEKAMQSGQ